MRKVYVVALREFKAAVLTKAFIISVAIMPLLMGGSMIVQAFLRGKTGPTEKKYIVIDRTGGEVFKRLKKAVEKRNTFDIVDPESKEQTDPRFEVVEEKPRPDVEQQRFELSERVRQGEYQGFLDIGKEVLKPLSQEDAEKLRKLRAKAKRTGSLSYGGDLGDDKIIRFYTANLIDTSFATWTMGRLNLEIALLRQGVKGEVLDKLENPQEQSGEMLAKMSEVPMVTSEPLIRNAEGKIETPKEVNFVVSLLIPIVVVLVMFLLVMIGASPLMQGVVEEKSQRIAEVLLASVRPFELMLGKLLGTVAVSLLLMLVYFSGGYWAAWYFGYDDYIQPSLLGWFLVFQVFAVLMYGSVFIAVGAACSDLKETQALLMPVLLVICFPMCVLQNVLREPDSNFAMWMSLIPPATPMLMMARMAVYQGIPIWQPILGICLVIVTTLGVIYAASRIFRVGLLVQGKGANYAQIAKWIFRG
jgi:ABC-2 type transport system permease protein